jgi:hypothetical protein
VIDSAAAVGSTKNWLFVPAIVSVPVAVGMKLAVWALDEFDQVRVIALPEPRPQPLGVNVTVPV